MSAPTDAEVIADLTRAKCMFQGRAITAAMGIMPGTIPAAPQVFTLTRDKARLLQMAIGGLGALKGGPEHRLATELEEHGLLKLVSDEGDRTYWRLCGQGLVLAARKCPHGEPLGLCDDCDREHREATR